jgi:mRNA interferase HigB
MHVFSRPKLRAFAAAYPDAATSLEAWFKIASRARWLNLHEIRADYPHADPVGSCIIFNIGGNKYRLITRVFYATEEFRGHVYVIAVLTHKDYDAGKWKKACDCD